jgi:hypothetical protein
LLERPALVVPANQPTHFIFYPRIQIVSTYIHTYRMAETLTLRGELKGHRGWVTAIAPPLDPTSDVLLSSSRYVVCR